MKFFFAAAFFSIFALRGECFEKRTFQEINLFFESVNSNLKLSSKEIDQFNQQKIQTGYITKKHKINLPYFIFPAKKETEQYVLYIGGIHADEFAPLYFSIKYLFHLLSLSKDKFEKNIIYIPLLNIDGFIEGIDKRSYPTRKNGSTKDLNRAFYAYDILHNYKSEPEIELVIKLIKKYRPKYWVIPHSSLNILDFDGQYDEISKQWMRDIHLATSMSGGDAIPIEDFRDYSPPNSKKDWSIGKLANHLGNVYSLTYEFSGPGDYPEDNDPNRYQKILRRKQLGRFEDTAWIAETYYDQYLLSMNKAIFVNDEY